MFFFWQRGEKIFLLIIMPFRDIFVWIFSWSFIIKTTLSSRLRMRTMRFLKRTTRLCFWRKSEVKKGSVWIIDLCNTPYWYHNVTRYVVSWAEGSWALAACGDWGHFNYSAAAQRYIAFSHAIMEMCWANLCIMFNMKMNQTWCKLI